ncbi:BirA family transcriptional regulator, biotin operon repressor / biotin-[acetyl-CoA-carboxylase] ligase [Verrucomicrobium sp. GAS474]|uniref:biotin--[acetyl-CoA-carboxylase] ligase n=1 Tax=Verrucomicrobium sp. GAS474 TaxID=1882831 RepID=UPI00087B8A01|nr:biotin--[acetyl-CoA-carboxylase] ligase [Verrucomicrobium sp. GAS474]SDT93543.1 BirA family transcriptional regulator, biotin operon repressor / biotin-[acetyl-CoA-carboxylase] ligase [Verrucomicrobium sp. GAS474]
MPASNLDVEILRALLADRATPLSGEVLAERCGVSRTAIWKHIASLQELGYPIASLPHQGYRMEEGLPDLLVADELAARLPVAAKGRIDWRAVVFRETQSTNDLALREAQGGAAAGLVIAAERQTKGRGRQGRKWHSKSGEGLWFSLLLRPGWPLGHVARLTIVAALAAAEAIDSLLPAEAGKIEIKWPNDLFHEGKKLGGILTEIQADAEAIVFAVVGIGINCRQTRSDFPDDIAEIATSLKLIAGEGAPRRIDLLAALLLQLEKRLADPFEEVREAWASRCFSLGRMVSVRTPGGTIQGHAVGLDAGGALLLRREGGRVEAVTAGDVLV